MTNAEICLKAADVIKLGGFIQRTRGSLYPADGPHCMLGALDVILPHTRYCDVSKPAGLLSGIVAANGLQIPDDPRKVNTPESWAIADWNNEPGRTAEEVIKAFHRAAEYFKKEEAQ